ncbi:MAG: hypothetical protein U5L96_15435 [Owenweeksia sp.]|nr:hypothetical protein [Owenweeksia sp.]
MPAQYRDAVRGVVGVGRPAGPSSTILSVTAEILTSVPFSMFIKYNEDNPYYNGNPGVNEADVRPGVDGQNFYTLGAFTLGGPINFWKNEEGKNVMGFLFSSEVRWLEEPRPGLYPYASLDEATYNDLQANPISVGFFRIRLWKTARITLRKRTLTTLKPGLTPKTLKRGSMVVCR